MLRVLAPNGTTIKGTLRIRGIHSCIPSFRPKRQGEDQRTRSLGSSLSTIFFCYLNICVFNLILGMNGLLQAPHLSGQSSLRSLGLRA